jgi:hypothetical protein
MDETMMPAMSGLSAIAAVEGLSPPEGGLEEQRDDVGQAVDCGEERRAEQKAGVEFLVGEQRGQDERVGGHALPHPESGERRRSGGQAQDR